MKASLTYGISVVVPVYNEGEAVLNIYRNLKDALDDKFSAYEIIFVNDASIDDTKKNLEALKQEDNNIVLFHLQENGGQSKALLTGICKARYEIVVMMDGDEQYDPQDIPKLCALLHGDIRLVSGRRDNRQDSFLYRTSSFVGNSMIALFFGMKKFDLGCGLKVAYKEDLLRMPYFRHVHRYFQIIYSNSGLRIAQVEINHRPRLTGESKYSILKVVNIIPRLFWLKLMNPKLKEIG